MITDAFLSLSSVQPVTGASAVLSSNTIDLQVARDIGSGEDVYARFQVGTAFAGVTALEMQVISAADAALTSSVTVLGSSGAIPVAQLTSGARHAVCINSRVGLGVQRYLGVRYVPTGTGTAGTITADIGLEVQDGVRYYASGVTVI